MAGENGDELQRLRNTVAELAIAVTILSSHFVGRLVGAGLAEREDLAQRLEALAQEAGARLAAEDPRLERPNPYVLMVANGVREIGRMELVQGARPDNDVDP